MFQPFKAPPRAQSATFCFSVHADNDVSVLPNVTAALAKRGLTPERLISTLFRHGQGELHVDFQVGGLDRTTAELLAKAMRRMICTRVVLTAEK
ncbi:MAG: hypothetical protein HQ513_16560 [Rhodospirillales bacterium]|nr:hypothetical protein [Rhodospirillales bacterium]